MSTHILGTKKHTHTCTWSIHLKLSWDYFDMRRVSNFSCMRIHHNRFFLACLQSIYKVEMFRLILPTTLHNTAIKYVYHYICYCTAFCGKVKRSIFLCEWSDQPKSYEIVECLGKLSTFQYKNCMYEMFPCFNIYIYGCNAHIIKVNWYVHMYKYLTVVEKKRRTEGKAFLLEEKRSKIKIN